MSRQRLDPRMPLSELHVHLGAAVTPAIMWGIAHAQGIRLPTKDYWAFRDLITVGRRRRGFDAYLDLFHWTELIQSSPIAVERSVYEVIGGAYRKNNVTQLELRFNPMKRNRGGEQDLDHIIAAAVRGMDRAVLEYPQVRAGLIFCLDRGFSPATERDHRRQGDRLAQPRGGGIDIAGPDVGWVPLRRLRDLFDECRRAGLGLTVHAGETGGAEEVREAIEALEPDRIGHGVHSARRRERAGDAARARDRCSRSARRSNLNTAGRAHRTPSCAGHPCARWIDERPFHPVDRWPGDAALVPPRRAGACCMRHEILSLDEVRRAIETGARSDASSTARRSIETSVSGRDRPETGTRRSPSRSRSRLVYCRPCPRSGGRSGSAAPARSLMVDRRPSGRRGLRVRRARSPGRGGRARTSSSCAPPAAGSTHASSTSRPHRAGRTATSSRPGELAQPRHRPRGRAAPIVAAARRPRRCACSTTPRASSTARTSTSSSGGSSSRSGCIGRR